MIMFDICCVNNTEKKFQISSNYKELESGYGTTHPHTILNIYGNSKISYFNLRKMIEIYRYMKIFEYCHLFELLIFVSTL